MKRRIELKAARSKLAYYFLRTVVAKRCLSQWERCEAVGCSKQEYIVYISTKPYFRRFRLLTYIGKHAWAMAYMALVQDPCIKRAKKGLLEVDCLCLSRR